MRARDQQLLDQKSITRGLELKCVVFEGAAALTLEERTESEILRRDMCSRVEELEALVRVSFASLPVHWPNVI